MHTASYKFLMKPKESAGCHQTLSARVGSGDETTTVAELAIARDMSAKFKAFSFPVIKSYSVVSVFRSSVIPRFPVSPSRAVLQVMDPDLCVSNNCGNECVH